MSLRGKIKPLEAKLTHADVTVIQLNTFSFRILSIMTFPQDIRLFPSCLEGHKAPKTLETQKATSYHGFLKL